MSASKNNQVKTWTTSCALGIAYPALTVSNGSSLPLGPGVFIDSSRINGTTDVFAFTGNAAYFQCVEANQSGGKYTVAPTLAVPTSGAGTVPNVVTKATLALHSVNIKVRILGVTVGDPTDLLFQVLGYDADGAAWTLPNTAVLQHLADNGEGYYQYELDTGYIPRGYSFYVGLSSSAAGIVISPVSCCLTAQPEQDGRD